MILYDNGPFPLQKFSVTARTFMLWKVNKSCLWQHVLDEMYHAALNLSLRVIHEQEQKKEVGKI